MKLLLVESPSKAKTIQKYLGSEYKVLATYGHIFEIPSENDAIDTQKEFKINYTVKNNKKLQDILSVAKDAKEIYLASDPDREGEGIAWEAFDYLHNKKKIKIPFHRITYQEITKQKILEAIQNARKIDDNLVDAQQSRAILDYLIGFNVSPVLWKKLKGIKSAGRVQSSALRLITEREEEVITFVPQEYWSFECKISDQKTSIQFHGIEFNNKKFSQTFPKNHEEALEIQKFAEKDNIKLNLISNDTKDIQKKPPIPFTTSSLQQEALNKFGFSGKKTMQIAQKLYEGIAIGKDQTALITYMRTDGTSISNDALIEIRKFIQLQFDQSYLPKEAIHYKTKVKNAQEAHEAIRPIDINQTPDRLKKFLNDDDLKLYSIIWARTVACQMANAISTQQAIVFQATDTINNTLQLKANASKIKFKGYLAVYGAYQSITDDELIECDNNAQYTINEPAIKQHFTSPPARYNEGSLIKTLESLGIGRPSTFASILSTLIDREYVKLDGKTIKPTRTGIIAATFLKNFFLQYVEYSFTSKLEDDLDNIANGTLKKITFLHEFWTTLQNLIAQTTEISVKTVLETLTNKMEKFILTYINKANQQCNVCNNGNLVMSSGKYGYFLSCSRYPDCKNIIPYNNQNDGIEPINTQKENTDVPIYDKNGMQVYEKIGSFGRYIQILQDEKKRNIGISKDIQLNEENIELLIASPKTIGKHEDQEVAIGIGKYGPYVLWNKKFISVSKKYNIHEINLKNAIEIIKSKKK